VNIFISGGAGFIGSHLSKKMIESSDLNTLVIYDNFSSGTLRHLADLAENSRVIIKNADIKNLAELTHAMGDCDIVVHFAANPDIAKAVSQPDIDFWEGTFLTQNILEAMRVNGVKKILYTSGSGVYGESDGTIFSESFGPCFPISTYGASKLACEALISSYCHMFGMQGRAFRFANVVGPVQTHGVGYDFIRRLKSNPNELRILGDGTQCKSYIHVDDVINAMMLVLYNFNNDVCFDVYNVATDDYITVTEIAGVACKVAGLDPTMVNYKYTGGDRGWKGDVPKVLFNVTKIKQLGWIAERTSFQAIEASIKAMIDEI